ncbi:unannotated protein [freshwater metagenome]|uniref:Unannotated protein n=1 Tax=freshwater metagenome TaxID=449393 RepID=A0A6J7E8A6_9ZZZZ
MQDGVGTLLVRCVGYLAAEQQVLMKGHTPSIFHRTGIKFGNKELVVLAEGVSDAEFAFKKFKTTGRGIDDVVGIKKFRKGLATEHTHRIGAVNAGVFAAFFVVGTSN